MREIKFRALTLKTKKWVYGYVNLNSKLPVMWCDDFLPTVIDPKTIGQYTGLKDKNGKEIYKGDIVKLPYIDPMGGINWDDDLGIEYNFEIGFKLGRFIIKTNNEYSCITEYCRKKMGEYICNYGNKTIISDIVECKVIGNIYEDSNLLK